MLKVEIIGNLGADCEVKDANGSKFVTFRVAHSEKYTASDGKEVTTTNWIDVTYNRTESELLKYLKQGTKVYVRGNAHLRAYSSKKDRCWKAGLSVAATEIELCGGQSDDVPRQLTDPDTGTIYNVTRHYWCDMPTKGMKKDAMRLLVDARGREYGQNSAGFVAPVPEQVPDEGNDAADNPDQNK